MGTLAADQERVKKLLTEAVTLLCRSSLTFSEEVAVEGLLGITLDKRDVFLVGIKEKIQQGIQAALVGGLEEESETEEAPLSKKRKSRKRKKRRRSGSSAETDASDAENNALSKRSKDEEQSMSDNIGDYPANVKSELSEQIAESQLSPTHSDSANDSQDTNTLTPAKVKLEKQDYDEDDCLLVDDGNNSNAWADGSQDSTNQFNLSGASNQFNISQGALFSPDGMPSTSGDMNDSVNRQKMDEIECPVCKENISRQQFDSHLKKGNCATKTFICEYCANTFSTAPGLRNHVRNKHHMIRFPCPSCSTNFKKPYLVREHLQKKHNQEYFRCMNKNCVEAFAMQHELEKHVLEIHLPEKTYKDNLCLICGCFMKGTYNYKNHMLIMHSKEFEKEVFKCLLCKERYFEHIDMKQHLKFDHFIVDKSEVHPTDEDMSERNDMETGTSFVCLNCDEEFSQLDLAGEHSCSSTAFSTPLRGHVSLVKRQLECIQCSVSFDSVQDMITHWTLPSHMMKMQTSPPKSSSGEDSALYCLQCCETFSTVSALQKHLKSFEHKDKLGQKPLKITCEDVRIAKENNFCIFCNKYVYSIQSHSLSVKHKQREGCFEIISNKSQVVTPSADGQKAGMSGDHTTEKGGQLTSRTSYKRKAKKQLCAGKEDLGVDATKAPSISCMICKIEMGSQADLLKHKNSKDHQKELLKMYAINDENNAEDHVLIKTFCAVCNIQFKSIYDIAVHEQEDIGHLAQVKSRQSEEWSAAVDSTADDTYSREKNFCLVCDQHIENFALHKESASHCDRLLAMTTGNLSMYSSVNIVNGRCRVCHVNVDINQVEYEHRRSREHIDNICKMDHRAFCETCETCNVVLPEKDFHIHVTSRDHRETVEYMKTRQVNSRAEPYDSKDSVPETGKLDPQTGLLTNKGSYYCEACNYTCKRLADYQRHQNTERHLRIKAGKPTYRMTADKQAANAVYCAPCNRYCFTKNEYIQHAKTNKHKKRQASYKGPAQENEVNSSTQVSTKAKVSSSTTALRSAELEQPHCMEEIVIESVEMIGETPILENAASVEQASGSVFLPDCQEVILTQAGDTEGGEGVGKGNETAQIVDDLGQTHLIQIVDNELDIERKDNGEILIAITTTNDS